MDLSDERREHALAWIKGEGLLDKPISDGAKIMAAVGVLICDDTGFVSKKRLSEAMNDPSVLQVATTLLAEAER